MTLFHAPSVQSPKAYDLANLSAAQLGTRLQAGANAALRANLRTALQDVGYRFKIHPAETAAGLVEANLNFGFDPGYVDRYGVNAISGTTDTLAAWNLAFKVAKTSGISVRYGATWPYYVSGPIDATTANGAAVYGFSVINEGHQLAVTNNSPSYPSIIVNAVGQGLHDGHVFDCTGSEGITWVGVTVGTLAGGTAPKTCWFLARNVAGGGSIHRFENCRVFGTFSEAIVYNYGAEDDQYTGCQFFQYQPTGSATAKTIRWTSRNNRALTSTFIATAAGVQSCIDHRIFGGEFENFNANAAADVFNIDTCFDFRFIGPWLNCADGSAAHGRSLFYFDSTNGPSADILITGVTGEAPTAAPNYGVLFGNEAVAAYGYVRIFANNFPNATAMIGSGASVTLSSATLFANSNSSLGGGVVVSGTLTASYCDSPPGGLTVGTDGGQNNLWPLNHTLLRNGEASTTYWDTSQAVGAKQWRIRNSGAHLAVSRCDDAGNVTANLIDISTAGIAFNGSPALAKPVVTGAKGGNAALASALTALASLGLITDSST